MDYDIIDLEAFDKLTKALIDFVRNLGEVIGIIVEEFSKLFEQTELKITIRQKYKPVLSLVKPYKQPYIKIRQIARSNI